ncbi:MAG TPA: hypothetical protein VL172_08755 [Kofleriaceae bacterium]|nr:hypothetical protein [Kofleriaceae bacterium]
MRSLPLSGGLAALLALGGCSLIYDAGGFTASDSAPGPPDARPIDAQIDDADINGLTITGTEPVDLAEGSGCMTLAGGPCTLLARAIPIVVNGGNIDRSAIVELDGAGFVQDTVPASVSEDHNQLAIAVRIPPDLGLAAGESTTLTITVFQGTVSEQTDVTVAGLDDFVASVDAAGGTLDIDATPLDARYATIDIDADIRFTGSEPVRLTATSAITVGAAVDVSGFDGEDGTAGLGGPGGCRGGVAVGAGQCTDGGGKGGGTNSGGGGGGNRIAGDMGIGNMGGDPGAGVGDETLAPLGDTGVRGNGGGGGGNGSISGAGGTGGGGGGTLVLTSAGDLFFETGAELHADGGGGSSGGGTCLLGQHGGAGGGGSGGAILIRAQANFVDGGSSATVAAGLAGDAGNGTGCNDGGAGAPGRVRIDLPSADADPALVGGTSAFRGVVIDPALPPVVVEAEVQVGVFGAPNQTYKIQVEGSAAQDVTTLSDRTGSATLTLDPGQNRICVLVNGNVTASSDEGAQCVTIAFMPP